MVDYTLMTFSLECCP